MSMKYITFSPFEKCAEQHYLIIKIENFVPFRGPSYGQVIILAMKFVDSSNLLPRPQYQYRLEYKTMRLF